MSREESDDWAQQPLICAMLLLVRTSSATGKAWIEWQTSLRFICLLPSESVSQPPCFHVLPTSIYSV